MIALKLSLFFLLFTVITAENTTPDPVKELAQKDNLFRECCVKRGVNVKFLEQCCTYTGIRARKNPPLDKELLADLPAIIECSADSKDNTDCCKSKKVTDACLPTCNGNPPIDLLKFPACQKQPVEEQVKVLDCYYENAYAENTTTKAPNAD
ncbi:DB module domain-containing protein [Ditylenchus destructor]|nr:DB module domain-containing protein [Ditylenchus destructor]